MLNDAIAKPIGGYSRDFFREFLTIIQLTIDFFLI